MTPPEPPSDEPIRRRQRAGARVTALILVALVVLFFAITIVKIGHGG